jgi:hypothetical protein
MTTMEEIRSFMEKLGIPGRDLYALPDSSKTFPDGCHYRMEIAGIESPQALETLISEAKKRKTPVHRIIATVGGASYLSRDELKEMAGISKAEGLEMIMTIGHRLGWDAGAKQSVTPEGQQVGFRHRGSDNISYYLADVFRCVELGFRGFLVYDEGVLFIVNRMREEGLLPKEVIFKISVFTGYASAAGAKVVESMGANTFNPISDLSLPILAGIRRTLRIPMDVYINVVDSFGGINRSFEAAEIARVCSPCYFKFEPGVSEGAIYKPWVSGEFHEHLVKEKVKMASIVKELVESMNPEIRLSSWGPKDLVLAQP